MLSGPSITSGRGSAHKRSRRVPELSTFASPITSINRWREMAYERKWKTQTGPRTRSYAPRAGLVSRTIRATSTLADHHEDVEIRSGAHRGSRAAADRLGRRYAIHGYCDGPSTVHARHDRGAEDILHVPDLELLPDGQHAGQVNQD